ncbi:class I SAM-dependent methyltransferase [Salisediminibacterium selenitireducens]|uniref:Methyltransferase small n=1 Tax=Bacillus selenitireducens (strain ATCC 700615 / DSM 15326 / MLS10) TaxID=439292 RepID=D6XVN1_BACIE|nr:methyltransferase [Salisediminibacterium selenitireducens]ADH97654.1 methyltransferase small [[Bacillus] selenitireducens MLS10]
MSDHYYTNKPGVKSSRRSFTDELRGQRLTFTVDKGVFSGGGVDFGSRLLIESFTEPETEGDLLDIGCGWGPIGIALAMSTDQRRINMIDVNERSVELARLNAEANGVADNVHIEQRDATEGLPGDGCAAILTNPPIRAGKDVVFAIYEEASRQLKHGGELWVVIQKKQGAPSTEEKLKALGLDVRTVTKKKGYVIFAGKKD